MRLLLAIHTVRTICVKTRKGTRTCFAETAIPTYALDASGGRYDSGHRRAQNRTNVVSAAFACVGNGGDLTCRRDIHLPLQALGGGELVILLAAYHNPLAIHFQV